MSDTSKHSFIFRCKDSISDNELTKLKQDIVVQGGFVTHEYSLFKGFAATIPVELVSTLEVHPQVESVEKDQEVRIQDD